MWATSSLLALALCGAPGDPGLPELPFERYQLANGLTVILHHDARLPLVAVSVWYDVGALHERPGRSGFAHLFEHMMFQGSLHVGEDKHFAFLEKAGATGVNGTTSFDRTNYFETVPRDQLELALWLESDRMGFLLPSLTEESFRGQVEVVKNERRQSVENRPYGLMDEALTQALYPPSHPYHGNVIGSMADLSAATLDDVRDFFRTYYSPANASLAIAGDFDPNTIKDQVEKYFGPLSGRARPPPPPLVVPSLKEARTIEFEEPVGRLPKISIAWMGPPAYDADSAALDLLVHVISGTKSSRLDRKVSYGDPLAASVTAHYQEQKAGSVFQIDLVTRPGRSLTEAREAIDAVLAELEARPPTEAELRRAQNTVETDLVRGLENLGGFGGRAERLQAYNLFFGDPGKLPWDVARYRAVTTADLSRVLKKYLGEKRLVVLATPRTAPEAR
jgi:zinc protease